MRHAKRAAMITPAYIRTMAEYNAEMNRRLFGAAARVTDAERREPRGAFRSSASQASSTLLAQREMLASAFSRSANKVDDAWLAEDLTWFSGAANREVTAK